MEGGNVSPEEAKSFTKCLMAESERINSFESLIKTDMEKMESSCMEQVCRVLFFQIMYYTGIFDVIHNQPAPRLWQLHDWWGGGGRERRNSDFYYLSF